MWPGEIDFSTKNPALYVPLPPYVLPSTEPFIHYSVLLTNIFLYGDGSVDPPSLQCLYYRKHAYCAYFQGILVGHPSRSCYGIIVLTIVDYDFLHLQLLLWREPVQGDHWPSKGQLLVLGQGWEERRGSAVLPMLPALADPLLTHYGSATSHCKLHHQYS